MTFETLFQSFLVALGEFWTGLLELFFGTFQTVLTAGGIL